MKIKVVLAKYLDWAILVGLALFLFFAVYKSFVEEDKTLSSLADEIRRADQQVQKGMKLDVAQDFERRDYVAELRDRLEHIPVVSNYRRNPFVPIEDIVFPKILVMPIKESKEIKIPGARLVEVLTPDKRVDVKLEYDPEDRKTTVTFGAGDQPTTTDYITMRIRGDIDDVYRFTISVTKRPEPEAPNPPINIAVITRPPTERKITVRDAPVVVREPPQAMISFMADNSNAGVSIGITTNAEIYRRPADGSDAEYVLITNKGMFLPASGQQINQMWERFRPKEEAPRDETAPRPTGPGGAVVPLSADEVRPAASVDRGAAFDKPAVGSFVFVDDQIEEGESYVYKVVTISTNEKNLSTPTQAPYVTPVPVNVPALVQFNIVSTSAGRARLKLSRVDPETNQPISTEVNVLAGQLIGGKTRISVRSAEGVDRGGPAKYKDVDFSTNCVLVDALTTYRVPECRFPLKADKKGDLAYKWSLKPNPRILYATPRGFLRVKEKEAEGRATSGATMAPTPGGGEVPPRPGPGPGGPPR